MKTNLKKHLLLAIASIIGFSPIFAQKKPVLNTSLMDLSVKPNDDFYKFVNGGWLKKTEIPADKKWWTAYNELQQTIDKDLLNILKQAAKNPKYTSNTDEGKVVNLFKTVMDTVGRNEKGVAPLKPYLNKINAIKNVKDLQAFLTEMEPLGGIGFFDISIDQDQRIRTRNTISIVPGSTGLSYRTYYISIGDNYEAIRGKYVLHLSRMLQFLGEKPAQAQLDAERILELETAMSRPKLTETTSQILEYTYNPMGVSDLQKLTPSIDWNAYLKNIGIKNVDSLIVKEPKYMIALESIFKENKIEDWKAYLRYTLLTNATNGLSTKIEKAHWEFYGKFLNKEIKQKPRDERALEVVNTTLGQLMGDMYVEKKFPLEAKLKTEKIVKNIVLAYQNRINNSPWMSAETKIKALDKLKDLNFNIGCPDKRIDYTEMIVKSPEQGGSYFENAQNISRYHSKDLVKSLNIPIGKSDWFLPQNIIVYYKPYDNKIIVSAAILQPPFFNYQADEAINYGAIGGWIAHEISHVFANDSRYNIDGDLVDWWTADDLKQFTALSDRIVNQYSAIEPLPGIYLDGKLTIDESIRDFGAVNVAYDALQLSLNKDARPALINGFTPEQRFFISWGTIHKSKIREENLNLLKWEHTSPQMYRSYVPLQNMDAFYEAFHIKEGDRMFIAPESRVKIW
jgi:predicted metalloendopeptidase